jgi:G:T-mismatch repair DNA endonuclease (very short patch repair protein)
MYNLTGYVILSDYIQIYCPKCDRTWSSSATNHIHPIEPRRCSTCSGSKGENEWLDSISSKGINIQRQYRIKLISESQRIITNRSCLQVDGYCEETNTVYEYLGCWYHGCPKREGCRPIHPPFNDDHIHSEIKKSMITLRNEWNIRKSVLEEIGYNVISIWECEWKLSSKTDL